MPPDLPLTIVYARSENYCIGAQGSVPWQLPAEYAFFEGCIRNKAVIMGRSSYEDHRSLLPDCLNIVLSRQANLPLVEGAIQFSDLPAAIGYARDCSLEPCVIGGSGLIEMALPMASNVYESVIHAWIQGDTWVPAFNYEDFDTAIIDRHSADENHRYSFEVRWHRRTGVNLP